MKVKIVDLTGAALDWLVAKCEGFDERTYMRSAVIVRDVKGEPMGIQVPVDRQYVWFAPSTEWAQGGPIIDREKISIRQWTNVPVVHAYMPVDGAEWSSDAKSPLVAAMRCYVMSKLGDEVDAPDELLKA